MYLYIIYCLKVIYILFNIKMSIELLANKIVYPQLRSNWWPSKCQIPRFFSPYQSIISSRKKSNKNVFWWTYIVNVTSVNSKSFILSQNVFWFYCKRKDDFCRDIRSVRRTPKRSTAGTLNLHNIPVSWYLWSIRAENLVRN